MTAAMCPRIPILQHRELACFFVKIVSEMTILGSLQNLCILLTLFFMAKFWRVIYMDEICGVFSTY